VRCLAKEFAGGFLAQDVFRSRAWGSEEVCWVRLTVAKLLDSQREVDFWDIFAKVGC